MLECVQTETIFVFMNFSHSVLCYHMIFFSLLLSLLRTLSLRCGSTSTDGRMLSSVYHRIKKKLFISFVWKQFVCILCVQNYSSLGLDKDPFCAFSPYLHKSIKPEKNLKCKIYLCFNLGIYLYMYIIWCRK